MKKCQFKKACERLKTKARSFDAVLHIKDDLDYDRLDSTWHHGVIAAIEVTPSLSIIIEASGEVDISLCNEQGDEIAGTADFQRFIRNDKELQVAIDKGLLNFQLNNWIEYNGVAKKNATSPSTFIDMSNYDNILDSDAIVAIEYVLDNFEEILHNTKLELENS